MKMKLIGIKPNAIDMKYHMNDKLKTNFMGCRVISCATLITQGITVPGYYCNKTSNQLGLGS